MHLVDAHPETLYVGTPAYLIATENPDGSANLAPASSYWALGSMLVLGLEAAGQTAENLLARPDITVNFPSGDLWRSVLKLDGTTGRNPVPADKSRYRFEADKFQAAGLTPEDSEMVSVPRVAECQLQFEARVARATPGLGESYYMVEAEVLRVHADPQILKPGTLLPDPRRWSPLVYQFRHFFSTGIELGWLPKSPTADAPPPA
ncbi:flavin reductase family protein [Microbacterium gubbeenense]|uniref:flavin reductase family protein n=1 Tax=Microbacterium gubbeenense TaxID=159896 RepID=UPI003F94902D